MDDGNSTPPPKISDKKVDEINRRIEFERSFHLSSWATHVESNFSREQTWSAFGVDFAQYGIKLLATLNGGAIFLSLQASNS